MTSPPADTELLERCAGGDSAAGRVLVDRYFDAVFQFFRTKIDTGAEDLTQQVFAACFAEPGRFRGEGTLRSYLLATARHKLFNHFRKQTREARALRIGDCSVVTLGTSPISAVAARTEARLLQQGLRQLPLDLQIVLELHYWEEATTTEIARVLEIPTGTVKTRLARARRKLREEIERARADPGLIKSTVDNFDEWLRSLRDQRSKSA